MWILLIWKVAQNTYSFHSLWGEGNCWKSFLLLLSCLQDRKQKDENQAMQVWCWLWEEIYFLLTFHCNSVYFLSSEKKLPLNGLVYGRQFSLYMTFFFFVCFIWKFEQFTALVTEDSRFMCLIAFFAGCIREFKWESVGQSVTFSRFWLCNFCY